jgi:hypothetical protein
VSVIFLHSSSWELWADLVPLYLMSQDAPNYLNNRIIKLPNLDLFSLNSVAGLQETLDLIKSQNSVETVHFP